MFLLFLYDSFIHIFMYIYQECQRSFNIPYTDSIRYITLSYGTYRSIHPVRTYCSNGSYRYASKYDVRYIHIIYYLCIWMIYKYTYLYICICFGVCAYTYIYTYSYTCIYIHIGDNKNIIEMNNGESLDEWVKVHSDAGNEVEMTEEEVCICVYLYIHIYIRI
jgi:hypothetical protein